MISDNRRLGTKLAVAALAMFGFGFALVPFYEQICEITGINNLLRPDRDLVNTQVDPSRSVIVQFDSNVHSLSWRFKPMQVSVTVHPGQMVRVDYEVENTLDRSVTGQAVPSYTPIHSGASVKKLECFCFTQQTLGPREKRIMPVVFTLDADLPADVTVMTLSYTFFEVAGTQG